MASLPATNAKTQAGRSAFAVRSALWVSVIAGCAAFESGIVLTSSRLWASIDSAHLQLTQSFWLTQGHRYFADVAVLAALLALILSLKDSRRLITGLIASILVIGSAGALFAPAILGAKSAGTVAALHALAGQIFLAGLIVSAVIASIDFNAAPRLFLSGGFPLRAIAPWLPVVLLSQVIMGALYRHDVWGIMPHMGGAMATAFLLVAEAVVLLQRAPEHRLLATSAKAALWLVLIQVMLGISDFLIRLLELQDSSAWFALSIAHASIGCLTFAVGSCLAVVVRMVLVSGDVEAAQAAV